MEILLKSGKELQEIVVTGTNASQNPVYTPQMGTLKISQKTVKSIPTLLGESDGSRLCRHSRVFRQERKVWQVCTSGVAMAMRTSI